MPNFNKNDFSGNPVRLDAPRSKFSMPFKHKTTFEAGKLIPIFSYGDVLPGDTFKVDLSCLVRMTTPVFPTMDDAYMDVYFFFTPHKLTLGRQMMSPSVNDEQHSWNAFIGAQDSLLNMPVPIGNAKLPFVTIHNNDGGGYHAPEFHSLADYLGIGLASSAAAGDWVDTIRIGISPLEPLAYYSIWNNYFRDENTMNPVVYSLGTKLTTETTGTPALVGRSPVLFSGFDGTDRWGDDKCSVGGPDSILPVCRPHGYFGSALPWPQRNGTSSLIPIDLHTDIVASGPFSFTNSNEDSFDVGTEEGKSYLSIGSAAQSTYTSLLYEHGLDVSGSASMMVNQLRLAVQTQRFYEALARGGNRIGEITASMFGVTPSDVAQDRPEYLGGKRIPISMDQVANTAGSAAGSQGQTLGSLGAYSNTGDSDFYFEKSFDTWGTLTCVICVRTNESFCQGLPRRYSRKERLDFYWPQFANLGEQPIYKRELMIEDNSFLGIFAEGGVFGYQEAWAEYRYLPDIVSGYLRPNADLGSYTYCNYFATAPSLAGYLDGTGISENIDRTLIVPAETAGFQFIGDFAFKIVATRPMPLYSIPGLVDHH